VVEPLSALSPPTLDGVDRLYRRHQLTSHPGPHCDTRAGASNLRLTNRIARGGHNDDFRYTTEELHSITTPYATSNEATECLSPSKVGRRPQIAVRRGKKRCKQHPQGGMTMIDHDDGKAGRSGGGGGVPRGCPVQQQASGEAAYRPPQKTPRGDLPNHAYPIRHKLKNESFMISGFLTQGTELEEDPGGSDTMPFPREDAIMTVYGGCPPPRRCHMSTLWPRASTRCGWGHGDTGV
jgi:hypothetical protein